MADQETALAGKAPVSAAGLRIAERPPLAMQQVAAFSDNEAAVGHALGAALGVAPPTRPNSAVAGTRATILWLGPERWLVTEPRDDRATVWHAAVAAAGGLLTDLGHARTVIRIEGEAARALLAKGVGPDLHPSVFPAGACLQTIVAHTNILLHAVDAAPCFDLYVPRSYAADFWDWLCDAARAPIGHS
jgi:heterotetrameric sarcosine oxidase gamma subunit